MRRPGLVPGLCLALLVAGCQPAAVRPAPEPEPAPTSAPAPAPEAVTRPPADPPADEPAAPAPDEATTAAPAAPEPWNTGAQVFNHLASRFHAPACIDGQHNQGWRKRYAAHPPRFAAQLEQTLPLLAYVAAEVDARGLPAEFALIPIVESWYRPGAVGAGGPAGLWQMVAATARHHGVDVRPGYDGRFNPAEATDAALAYLQTLQQGFDGDWRAVAMAYNAGEYRIRRAFRANGHTRASGEERLPTGLSATTYAYVAKLRALACLIAEPERHGLELPRDARFTPLRRVELPAGVRGLDQAAHWLGTDAAALRKLNPAFAAGRPLPEGAGRVLLVPDTPLVRQRLAAGPPEPSSLPPAPGPRRHEIRPGDTLSAIAARYGVPLKQLYALNGMDARSILRPGRWLRIDP